MFIKHLYGPSGERFEDNHIENPTWQDVEQAIRQLDGWQFNCVMLHPHENQDRWMGVCGGEEGLLFVTITTEHEGNFILIDPMYPDKEEPWSFLVNQSDTECYRYEVCELEPALKAAKTFVETGTTEPSLTWRQD